MTSSVADPSRAAVATPEAQYRVYSFIVRTTVAVLPGGVRPVADPRCSRMRRMSSFAALLSSRGGFPGPNPRLIFLLVLVNFIPTVASWTTSL